MSRHPNSHMCEPCEASVIETGDPQEANELLVRSGWGHAWGAG